MSSTDLDLVMRARTERAIDITREVTRLLRRGQHRDDSYFTGIRSQLRDDLARLFGQRYTPRHSKTVRR